MARSLSAIRMDFSKAKRQAGDLESAAANIRNLAARQMASTLNQIACNWTGDNAKKYLDKGETLQGQISATADALDEVADAIRQIAETIYEAEMDAWERAHDRD